MKFVKDWLDKRIDAKIDKYVTAAKQCVDLKTTGLSNMIDQIKMNEVNSDKLLAKTHETIVDVTQAMSLLTDKVSDLNKKLDTSCSDFNRSMVRGTKEVESLRMDMDYKITGLNKIMMDRIELLNLEPKHTADLMRRIAELEGMVDWNGRSKAVVLGMKNEYLRKMAASENCEIEKCRIAANILSWVLGEDNE